MTKSFDREPYLKHSNVAPDVTLSDYIARKKKAMSPKDYGTNCAPFEPAQPQQAEPVAPKEEENTTLDVLLENNLFLSNLLNHMHQPSWFCHDTSVWQREIKKLFDLNSQEMDKELSNGI